MTSSDDSRRDDILRQALALSAADRGYLVDQLEQSLPSKDSESADIALAWLAEIDRRIALYDSGAIQAVDMRTAIAQMRQTLEERRSQSGTSKLT
jgi:putative addiction module component (TIGR02574 family)